MKELEVGVGDSIGHTIRECLSLSCKHKTPYKFKFNGLYLEVDYEKHSDSQYYLQVWNDLCRERGRIYKASSEYKQLQERLVRELTIDQNNLDIAICRLPLAEGLQFVGCLKEFIILSDKVGTTYGVNFVLELLQRLGYKQNEYVGYEGKWSQDKMIKYVTGQVIDGLITWGLVPPVGATFCAKILEGDY